jgi:hypothetical protein
MRVSVAGTDILSCFGTIDINADLITSKNKIRFYYKGDRGAKMDNWNRLYNKKLTRFYETNTAAPKA